MLYLLYVNLSHSGLVAHHIFLKVKGKLCLYFPGSVEGTTLSVQMDKGCSWDNDPRHN